MIREDRIMGMTSNPAIFEQAIAKTDEYNSEIERLLKEQPSLEGIELFNHLAIPDIQAAADAFRSVWDETQGLDGMVSFEVAPDLAHDAEGTVAMAEELWARIDRPNLMIKVPGTAAGVSAFEEITAKGINVNVTLLFSVSRYREIAQAWINGLQRCHAAGKPLDRLQSVASFFVSRVDSEVDKALEANGSEAAMNLRGKIAIANAKLAYGHFANLYGSEQFQQLRAHGANPQRLLWASTGTKNPDYSDVLYVEELIGPDTVNTLPPKTMDAFRDHGTVDTKLTRGLAQASEQLNELAQLGVSLSDITDGLEAAGIASFQDAFDNLLQVLANERARIAG